MASAAKFSSVTYHMEYVPNALKSLLHLFNWPKSDNIKIVDIGTGPGQMLFSIEPIYPKNYKEIVGLDIEKGMVDYLNSINKDERIIGRQLDIQTKELPRDLKQRFDFAFSSYCFTFVKDMRTAFLNTSALIKPNGEFFGIWGETCHLYSIYKKMSDNSKWSSYTSDFKDWRYHFDNANPIGILEEELQNVGLESLEAKILNTIVFRDKEPNMFLNWFDSLDFVSGRVPSIDVPKFKEEFHQHVLSHVVVDDKNGDDMKATFPYPSLVVAARKREN